MDRARFVALIDLTISMAADYALETRIRRLIFDHLEAGATPRTLVMNAPTWFRLVEELDGRGFRAGYFWSPQSEGEVLDPGHVTTFMGLPILIKDFLPDLEVIIGV